MIGKLFLLACLALTQVSARHIESDLCPASMHHWLLPHEYDCTKFYYCEYGLRWETPTSCAPGTEFSYTLQVCTWPHLAGCTLTGVPPTEGPPSTDPPPTTTTTAAPTTTTPAATTTTAAPVTVPPPPTDPRCPDDPLIDVLLPHPDDCGKFLQCVHGRPVERDCPSGLHFNVATQECDWPASAGCGAVVDPPRPPPEDTTTTAAPITVPPPPTDPRCPDDPLIDVLLPHPDDCGKFLQCVHGRPVERDCPSGLHFNVATQECDWPASAGCGAVVDPPRPPPEDTTTTAAPITVPPPPTDPRCPDDPLIDVLLPHPDDCGKFLQCVHGRPVERDCPSGLHFNVATQECDWPASAGCGAVVDPPRPPPEDTTTTAAPITVPPPPTDPRCPDDPLIDVLLPHPDDCGKFLQCVHGRPVERDCPSGLHFNVATQECDWPASAGCGALVDPPRPPPEDTTTTAAPITVPPPPTDPRCPDDPLIDVLLPHPDDCGKFLQCVHGRPVERDCPSGLHFNVATQECDWPASAGCGAVVDPPRPPPEDTTTTAAPITVPPPPTDPRCPDDPLIDVLLPHPDDCGKFLQCVHGRPVERDCPSGLHFNVATQECDWPASAGCGAVVDPPRPPPEDTTTTAAPITVPPPPTDPRCPDDPLIDVLLPHPDDCGKFLQCVHGRPVERDCPSGLHFNVATQRCDWPASAGCEAVVDPPRPPPEGTTTTAAPITVPPPPTDPRCPDDPLIDVLLPHPDDCGKFLQCVHGRPVERDCPSGLHFNVAIQRCDWPASAGCEAVVDPPRPPPEGTTTTAAPITVPPPPTDPRCPDDPLIDVLLPHPDDCGKFLQCVHGRPVERDCPSGLHFNVAIQRCDWPASAGCEAVVTDPTTRPPPVDTTTTLAATTTTAAPITVPPPPPDPVPTRCEDCNVLPWAHETDCDKFWRCDGHTEVLVTCSLGLHFNPDKGSCDYICNAGCAEL